MRLEVHLVLENCYDCIVWIVLSYFVIPSLHGRYYFMSFIKIIKPLASVHFLIYIGLCSIIQQQAVQPALHRVL